MSFRPSLYESAAFIQFGIPPSLTSHSSSSVCWLCGRGKDDNCDSFDRFELSDPSSTREEAVYRYGREVCSYCSSWCKERLAEGGEFTKQVGKMGKSEWTMWVTRKMKEQGLERRRSVVKEEDGGSLRVESTPAREGTSPRFTNTLSSNVGASYAHTFFGYRPLPSNSLKRSSESQLEPSSSRKARVQSSQVASGRLEVHNPLTFDPNPTSPPPPPPKKLSSQNQLPYTFPTPLDLETIANAFGLETTETFHAAVTQLSQRIQAEKFEVARQN